MIYKFLPKYIFFVCLTNWYAKKILNQYFLLISWCLKILFFLIPFISTSISKYIIHVYDISPIFMTNNTKFFIEFKSYILLLWFLTSDIFRQILWLIYKFIPKYLFFVHYTLNIPKIFVTWIFCHYFFSTMLCPRYISHVYQL